MSDNASNGRFSNDSRDAETVLAEFEVNPAISKAVQYANISNPGKKLTVVCAGAYDSHSANRG
jgi:hypothetical protein